MSKAAAVQLFQRTFELQLLLMKDWSFGGDIPVDTIDQYFELLALVFFGAQLVLGLGKAGVEVGQRQRTAVVLQHHQAVGAVCYGAGGTVALSLELLHLP